jgi:simple sugar transport system ATP-binding protein
LFRANSNLARLGDCGVNAIMTESDSYKLSALDATVVALKNASLQLPTGEITGIGDNGAGKFTLIKIISGVLTPDSRSIEFLGKLANFASSADAREQGVETVYQDLALAGNLAVWANLYLGRELTFGPKFLHILDKRAILSKTSETLRRFIRNVPPIAE